MNKENQLLLQICSALSDAAIVVLSMLMAYLLRFRDLHGEAGVGDLLGAIDIPGYAFIGADKGIRIIFLQPQAPVLRKAVGALLLPGPLI